MRIYIIFTFIYMIFYLFSNCNILFISILMESITFLDKKEPVSPSSFCYWQALSPLCYTGHIIKQEIIKS